ncbi:MAG: hypothetical protein GY865_13015, partial [candidate division Zixibacteria bacterium]|nr:hypothetical protein [candidate division Zixibacteria bacterium]
LRNDAAAPFDERLNKESAMMALEDAANSTGFRSHPFLNQHILVRNSEREGLQKRFFNRLFDGTEVHQINVGIESNDLVLSRIKEILTGEKAPVV